MKIKHKTPNTKQPPPHSACGLMCENMLYNTTTILACCFYLCYLCSVVLWNDIKQIVEPQNKSNLKYELNELVVDLKTGRQMRIKEFKDNKYSCYINSGATFVGDFDESEIKKFNWLFDTYL